MQNTMNEAKTEGGSVTVGLPPLKAGRRKPNTYIINEANGDRHAGTFATYKAACAAFARNYDEEDLERCQPSIGMVREDGTVTYEL